MLLLVPFLCGDLFGGNDEDDEAPDVIGTAGNDTLNGTEAGEKIMAGAGDDGIAAWSGDDTVNGEEGNDFVLGEMGDDLIFGDAGDDLADGGAGNDTIWLGEGDDIIADDTLVLDPEFNTGAAGDDRISGGDGNDFLIDWQGSDSLNGELGRDTVVSVDDYGTDHAADVNSGGWGMDTLWGDDGDTMTGGGNADDFTVYVDEADDSAVTISDFDGANETLFLELPADIFDGSVPELSAVTDPLTGDVTVSADGKPVAVLTNPANFDLATNVLLPWWMTQAA